MAFAHIELPKKNMKKRCKQDELTSFFCRYSTVFQNGIYNDLLWHKLFLYLLKIHLFRTDNQAQFNQNNDDKSCAPPLHPSYHES